MMDRAEFPVQRNKTLKRGIDLLTVLSVTNEARASYGHPWLRTTREINDAVVNLVEDIRQREGALWNESFYHSSQIEFRTGVIRRFRDSV